jgi:hypothetical protein
MDINNDALCVAHDSDSKDSVNLTNAMLAIYNMAYDNSVNVGMHIYPSSNSMIRVAVYDKDDTRRIVFSILPDDLSDINVYNFRQQLTNAIHEVTSRPSNVIHKV